MSDDEDAVKDGSDLADEDLLEVAEADVDEDEEEEEESAFDEFGNPVEE